MKLGLTIFATDRSIDVAELAVEAESHGFDSLWIPEHTHIPVSRRTPSPMGGDELAEEYKRSVDPLVALSFAAARTSRIHLGTGIMLPAQRDPIVTAKALATLQNLSGGRLELGIGFGWNAEEMESHGVDYSTRRARTREHMLAMRALWNDEVAAFDGEFVSFEPSWSWPKPQSEIPVLIGGGPGPKLFTQIVEYADGWLPIGGSGLTKSVPVLRHMFEDAGRDPQTLRIVPFGTLPTAEKLDHFADLGVTECIFRLPSAGRDEVMQALESHAELVRAWRS